MIFYGTINISLLWRFTFDRSHRIFSQPTCKQLMTNTCSATLKLNDEVRFAGIFCCFVEKTPFACAQTRKCQELFLCFAKLIFVTAKFRVELHQFNGICVISCCRAWFIARSCESLSSYPHSQTSSINWWLSCIVAHTVNYYENDACPYRSISQVACKWNGNETIGTHQDSHAIKLFRVE